MLLLGLLMMMPQVAPPAPAAPGIDTLLAATAGRWEGRLEYRDYQDNSWQGLPVSVEVTVQPDRVTMLRTARFDDGPTTGNVWITTATLFDAAAATLSYATLRKGRPLDTGAAKLALEGAPADVTHWTIVQTETRRDGDAMARVRETTVRDGAMMTTTKEVDIEGDGKDEWLPRNRTVLQRMP